jgi:hypothetical protein
MQRINRPGPQEHGKLDTSTQAFDSASLPTKVDHGTTALNVARFHV